MKHINEYKEYLAECWKEAEDVGRTIGSIDNKILGILFNKIAQPYIYWLKDNKKD